MVCPNTKLTNKNYIHLYTAPSAISSSILGLYTAVEIPKDCFIINYTGRVIEIGNNFYESTLYDLMTQIGEGQCYGLQVKSNTSLEAFGIGS